MKNCIFCKISKGKIKVHKIHANKKVICFLDINPINKGHCLVVPKKHHENIFDIKEKELQEVIKAVKKVSIILRKKLGAKGVNILHASGKTAQQSVPHFHIHVVPRYKNDKLDTWPKSKYKEKSFEKIHKKILK